MLPLIWIPEAQRGLQRIVDFVAERNPDAAIRLRHAIEYSASLLPSHPYLYRTGRVPGTRELVALPNYIVVYQVAAQAIRVLSVLHASQQYP